jgi:GNAT superfamily N-acetyltransferase
MRDIPGRSGDERNPEYIVLGISPRAAARALRSVKCVRGGVCVIEDASADLDRTKEAYKRYGMRLLRREPFFALRTDGAMRYESPVEIVRAATQEVAEALNKANRRRQILPEHIGREDTVRLYGAFDGDRPIGWVSSIPAKTANWVSNLYVTEAHRGQGIGRALMSHMLQEDRSHGVEWSVLLASGAGARLYPHLGYERIGTLQLFTPTDVWRRGP